MSEKKISALDFDKILEKHVGPLGLWQWLHLFVLFLVSMCAGIAVVTFAFTGFVPKYRCLVPPCENIESAVYAEANGSNFHFVDVTFDHLSDARCQQVTIINSSMLTCDTYEQQLESNNSQIESCAQDNIVFDQSIVLTSITQDYGLTCQHAMLRSIFNSLYLGGMLVGSFVIGLISDNFGRKKAVILSIFLVGISGTLAAIVNNKIAFAFLRITAGMGGMGCFMVPSVMATEATLANYKIYTSLAIGLGFVTGELVLTLQAYLIRDWVSLQLASHAPMLSLLCLYFFLPESTRWLLSKGKVEEAIKDIEMRAKINGRKCIPKEAFLQHSITIQQSKEEKQSLMNLFKPKVILKRSFNMFWQWFSVTMSYYGLLFASTGLSGDPYVNFALVVSAELLNIPFYLKATNVYGRKISLILAQFISGICCIIGGLLLDYPDFGTLQVIFVMIGRAFAAAGFGLCYLYTSEMFPTGIRNTAIGTCSTVARLGGIVALLIQGVCASIWPPLTMLIFGSVAISAGCLATVFPETLLDNLPESMEDALNLGQNIRRNKFGFILS